MTIIKCKMCGGDMEMTDGQHCGTCEYCGSTMTLPKVDDEQRAAAFNRGNHFRRIGEFDKALTVYERIVQEDDSDAEAHWCCALCRFGIEYVKDPVSGEYVPTCHRASFNSFLEDVDYKAALEHADAVARLQYEKDGEKIAQIQRGILSVSQKEQPFDVFLCYKESDEQGNRTVDSTLAQDIYYRLTDQGFRVFFSRVTLEDKVGQAYEPYIFAALHSAKVMIVVGTKPEYLNAVWVKNEWSRYLSIMKNDRKKLLIPCYRDMDPYDMPEQLSVLQSYDMAKIGFIQDLVRGISKIIAKESPVQHTAAEAMSVPSEASSNLTALLKRGYMALEDQEWGKADEFFEQVLNLDAECSEAFFGKYLAEQTIPSMDAFMQREMDVQFSKQTTRFSFDNTQVQREAAETYQVPGYLSYREIHEIFETFFTTEYLQQTEEVQRKFDREKNKLSKESENRLLSRSFQYASGRFAGELDSARIQILETLEQKLDAARQWDQQEDQRQIEVFENHKQQLLEIVQKLHGEALEKREADYKTAFELQEQKKYGAAKNKFYCVGDYKDAKERIAQCKKTIDKRIKTTAAVAVALIAMAIGSIYLYQNVITPSGQYRQAETLLAEGDYDGATAVLVELGNYKDAANRALEIQYAKAETLLEQKNEIGAAAAFMRAGGYRDASERYMELCYRIGVRRNVDAGSSHTVGLKIDGTVVVAGNNLNDQCTVSDWTDIVAIAVGSAHTVGVKANGTVVATGSNLNGQCDVSSWTDIAIVDAGSAHTVGVKANGTVVAAGNNLSGQCTVSGWTDMVAVAAGTSHTVGVKADGTVVAAGNNSDGQCDVSGWTDMAAVAAGSFHTVGLKVDGSVVATGNNTNGQCDVSGWTDIVAVAAGTSHTVGVKADGTVVAAGNNLSGQCDVSGWTDIVAVAAGTSHTVGVKADGTVIAMGSNLYDQCDVSRWTCILFPASSKEE